MKTRVKKLKDFNVSCVVEATDDAGTVPVKKMKVLNSRLTKACIAILSQFAYKVGETHFEIGIEEE